MVDYPLSSGVTGLRAEVIDAMVKQIAPMIIFLGEAPPITEVIPKRAAAHLIGAVRL